MDIAGLPITIHNKPYEAISPLQDALSQSGRTILVCGGSTGIGRAIAENFCVAGATRVIILARRSDVLDQSIASLGEKYPAVQVSGRTCDFAKIDQAKALWDTLHSEHITVDVLALNAVSTPALQPILDQGSERLWEDFEANVHAPLYFLERFYKQPNHKTQKFCLYVSTQDTHNWDSAPIMPGYQLTKNSCTCMMQQIARDVPREKLQIVSFHPSVVFTEAAQKAGYTKDTLPWTDENIPGSFAVWAASGQAAFLHGRFVWSSWDVVELASGDIRKKIDSDPYFLKVGVKGL